jgi:hypothetical protein
MSRFWLLSTLAFVLLALFVFAQLVAPWAIKRRIISMVHANCPSCKIQIGAVDFSLVHSRFSFENAHLVQGDTEHTQVEASVQRINAELSLLKLLTRHIAFDNIYFQSPIVIVTEGNLRGPASAPTTDQHPPDWTVSIKSMQARDGQFKYERVRHPQNAVVSVSKIEASVGTWGTTPELSSKITQSRATGQLEKSGTFKLELATPMPAKSVHADISIELVHQDIADMNAFFERNDGVKLKGSLVTGKGISQIRGKKLRASIVAEYDGLNIDFDKLLPNLIKTFKLKKSNVGKSESERTGTIEINRDDQETIMHFIVRGFKEAAMKVSM